MYFQVWTEGELSRNDKKDDRWIDSQDIHLFEPASVRHYHFLCWELTVNDQG